MATYNQQLLQNAIDAYPENGYKITDEKALRGFLIQKLHPYFVRPPTQKVMQNFQASQNKTPLQKLIK